jgi:hypothetical protein
MMLVPEARRRGVTLVVRPREVRLVGDGVATGVELELAIEICRLRARLRARQEFPSKSSLASCSCTAVLDSFLILRTPVSALVAYFLRGKSIAAGSRLEGVTSSDLPALSLLKTSDSESETVPLGKVKADVSIPGLGACQLG